MILTDDEGKKIKWSNEPGATPLEIEVREEHVAVILHHPQPEGVSREVEIPSTEFAFLMGTVAHLFEGDDEFGRRFLRGAQAPPMEECEHAHSDTEFDIREHIEVHLVTTGDEAAGWAHTHGMEQFDLPNLEIRGLPLYMGPAAADILNHVADYMLDCKRRGDPLPQVGENMGLGPSMVFQFVDLPPIKGQENHFEHPRLALSDVPLRGHCAHTDCNCEEKSSLH